MVGYAGFLDILSVTAGPLTKRGAYSVGLNGDNFYRNIWKMCRRGTA